MIYFSLIKILIYSNIYSTIILFSNLIINGQLIENDIKKHLFNTFIERFQKNYTNQIEYNFRFQVFKNSLNRIQKLNNQRKRNTDAIYGITNYSDLTPEEFKIKISNGQIKQYDNKNKPSEKINESTTNQLFIKSNLTKFDKFIENYLSLNMQLDDNNLEILNFENLFNDNNLKNSIKRKKRNEQFINIYDQLLPSNYPRKKDWRELNAISPVDNQGVCGACWSHSVIETIESMAFIKYRLPVNKRLSVQQLIDCSSNNYGCLGGDTCAVLSWIAENKIKLLSAKAYPTRSNAGECRIKNENVAVGLTVLSNFTCTNFTNNEIELIKILADHGPVATIASATQWQDYLGGIIQFNCNNEANHAVQIVGYNLGETENDVPYYIVRNTWGSNFGINGYLHVGIGGNLCALEERVSALQVEMI